jgi:hypothetical protein
MEDDFKTWVTTSIFWESKDDLNFLKMEDNINKNANLTNSTGNLTITTTKNILAQMKKSTLIGCDMIVN